MTIAGPLATAPLRDWLPRGDHPSGLGGSPVTRLVDGLLRRGVSVEVVTLDRGINPGSDVVVEGDGLRVHYGPYRRGRRARDAFAVERAYVQRGVELASGDVTHAHWSYEFALGALAVDPDTVATYHDWGPVVLRFEPHPYRLVRLGMQARVVRRARHATAVSPYLAAKVAPWSSIPVPVVPNAIPASLFMGADRRLRHRDPRLCAMNAGWGPRKNVAALLRAFALVRDRRPDVTLDLYGPGYGVDDVAFRWARRKGLTAGVAFHGAVPEQDAAAAMLAADVFVHPSREETFGMVVAEAMAQRLPVVAGHRSGAVPWVLGDGEAGRLVDVDHPPALADAILGLLAAPDEWEHLADNAQAHAWDRFRSEVVVEAYLDRYADARTAASTPT